MSVLIKKMEMPRHCGECSLLCYCDDCYFCGYEDGLLYTFGDSYLIPNERPNNCPLTEVPTPHGRLIDADDVLTQTKQNEWCSGYQQGQVFGWNSAIEYIGNFAPTVIESEE